MGAPSGVSFAPVSGTILAKKWWELRCNLHSAFVDSTVMFIYDIILTAQNENRSFKH